jgi:Uma2 family endonuclease
VETYCLEREIDFQTVGSWTIKERRQDAGAEPDECYVFSNLDSGKEPVRPDLAIEVEWTSRLLNKLEIYARLEVREVWVWRKNQLTVHVLRPDGKYRKSQKSMVVPDLDLPQLLSFIDRPTTSRAIRDYRAALRRG